MNPTSSAGVYQGQSFEILPKLWPLFESKLICHLSFEISHLPFEAVVLASFREITSPRPKTNSVLQMETEKWKMTNEK